MNKFLIISVISLLLIFNFGCMPASREKLKETRVDLLDLTKGFKKLAESHEVLTKVVVTYVEMPEQVARDILQDSLNRVSEAKILEAKIEKHSTEEVGIFSKSFGAMMVQFFEVAKPHLEKVVKAVVDVASSQGGVYGMIASGLALAYGVYQQVSKNTVVAKVKEEKAEAKEIEHEADKIIPVEHHVAWDKAEKEARIKVLSTKKGIS